MKIRRGTTPTITAIIKDNIDLSSAKAIWLSISQNGKVVIDKTLYDFTISGAKISVTLTQEDTLSLMAGVMCYIQERVLFENDIADASQSEYITVDDVIKDGEITDERIY